MLFAMPSKTSCRFLGNPNARFQRTAHGRRNQLVDCRACYTDGLEALLFDCDGVIVDTEKDGHRCAFNAAFRQMGIPHTWDIDTYGRLLAIGGGKERMMAYFSEQSDREPFKSTMTEEGRRSLVKEIHTLKTKLFQRMIEDGQLPLRPGVLQLIEQAIENGTRVAVCSTSNEKAVQTIVDVLLGTDVSKVMRVFAGDIVTKKKPDPEIYLLAATALGVDPERCVVIEDSYIGVQAAKAAGMTCVVTKSGYTADEDFTRADAVYDCIGAPGQERFKLLDLTDPPKLARV